jgi:DNA-binding beta-propeller fold protein YncE
MGARLLSRGAVLVVAATGGMLAPAIATAVTVTVGRQSLTGFNDYFHCEGAFSTNCDNTVSPTTLTGPGDLARVPADGTIVAWRVVGACILSGGVSCDHELRVLRPDGGNFTFVAGGGDIHTPSTCDRCSPLDGSKVDVTPGLTVQAGDYLGVSEEAVHEADVRIMSAPATGAAYNAFVGLVNDGSSASPIPGADHEPLFNADVALDTPVVTGIGPDSGSTTGGQTVTITGDHLAGASQVRFGNASASSFTVVSTAEVRAVAPPHVAGTVGLTVTTAGGTNAAASASRFTFVSPPSGGGGGSVYVANGADNNVWQFNVADSGLLKAMMAGPVQAGTTPWAIAISPDGRSLYVSNVHSQNVSQYDISPAGQLAHKPAAVATAGLYPFGIAVSPDGHSVYVTNGGDDDVSQYDVAAGGRLIAKTPATVAVSSNPRAIAISPDGGSVYVPNANTNNVSQFDVGAGGRLTPKTPALVGAGLYPSGIAVSPDGRSAYVTNSISNSVSQFDVGAGGRLTPKAPPIVQAGSGPSGIAISPDGRSVYVSNYLSDSVSQFSVGVGGRLIAKTPATVQAGSSPSAVAVTPNGRSVYVSNSEDGTVSQYDVRADGQIAGKPIQMTVAAGQEPEGIALLPDQGPVAVFRATAAMAGSPTRFDASSSGDPDGGIVRYDWDFGDGTKATNRGPRPVHTYAAAGRYRVTLVVADNAGCSTAFVFTGQTALCNGSPAARTTRTVTVPPAKADFTSVRSPIQVDGKGRFKVRVRATSGLEGRAAFKSVNQVRISRKKQVVLAGKAFRVPPSGTVTLRLTLSKTNLRILRLNRKIRARLIVTLKTASGLTSRASRKVTLKAPSG